MPQVEKLLGKAIIFKKFFMSLKRVFFILRQRIRKLLKELNQKIKLYM